MTGAPKAGARRVRWFVYVARCADGSIYTGIARDVAARLAEHDAGKGARYTRGRGPLTLLAVRPCASHGNALRLELAVKALRGVEKERLADAERFRTFAARVTRTARKRAAKPRPARTRGSRP